MIDIKERFVPKKGKVYLLLRKEQKVVHKFISEQLRKGYIRLSKLPQTALVFFVGKKDGKKEMVQNYRYLNEWIVKNNYLLPLILNIVENISTKKVFTKMDLRQSYNNVWIKKKDEWKAAFTIPEGLSELTVMFFGVTNLLVIFQTIMNEILQDLINTGKVASFIDDVIIGTEREEEHDELVEEVVRRLAENNLYVKLEKYKWKIKKVGFLGVVIGSEGIKIEEDKVKEVLDWLTSKCVKNVQKFLELVNYYCQFIQDFISIARSLHDMVKKDQKWNWTDRQEEVFRKLKEKFIKELVLVAPDLNLKK